MHGFFPLLVKVAKFYYHGYCYTVLQSCRKVLASLRVKISSTDSEILLRMYDRRKPLRWVL